MRARAAGRAGRRDRRRRERGWPGRGAELDAETDGGASAGGAAELDTRPWPLRARAAGRAGRPSRGRCDAAIGQPMASRSSGASSATTAATSGMPLTASAMPLQGARSSRRAGDVLGDHRGRPPPPLA